MVIPGVVQAIDMFDKEIVLLSKKSGVSKYIIHHLTTDYMLYYFAWNRVHVLFPLWMPFAGIRFNILVLILDYTYFVKYDC